MAKKVKTAKLKSKFQSPSAVNDKNPNTKPAHTKSVFNNFAEKLQIAKQKKIQKLSDTKNRVMQKKKQNKMVKVPAHFANLGKVKKANKFALLDDNQQNIYEPSNKLTHKGTSFDKIKHFNDMNFDNNEMDDNQAEFDDMHGQVNFHGFDDEQQDNEDNRNKGNNDNRRKSKNQIYKQIIQKSKMHKRDRQQQYEQNFNAAVELDEEYPQFVSKLKFRTADAKVRDKIQKTDHEYQKLMNELKDDQRVVANRVVDNNKKGAEKIKKKKNQQLNELMRNDSDEQQQDIRGWVKGMQSDDGDNEESEEDEEQDQLDDVALSSGDEEEEDGEEEDGEGDGEQVQIQGQGEQQNGESDQQQLQDDQSQDKLNKKSINKPKERKDFYDEQSQQVDKEQSDEDDDEQQQDDDGQQEEEEQEEQEEEPKNKNTKKNINTMNNKHKQINKNVSKHLPKPRPPHKNKNNKRR